MSFDELRAARLERATSSTGKPQQVKPASIGVESHVLVDVQKGVAVLAPILERKAWLALYEEVYGPVSPLPTDDENLTGYPVRVGRQTLYLCPTNAWLLVRLPAGLANAGDAEQAPSGKDAAAGA